MNYRFVVEDIPSSQDCTSDTNAGTTDMPRPLNSFFVYRTEMSQRADLKQLNLHGSQLSKVISIMWEQEDYKKKIEYQLKGELNAVERKKTHPYYNHKKHSKARAKRSRNKKQQSISEKNWPLSHIDSNSSNSSNVEKTGESSNEVTACSQIEPFTAATPPSSLLEEIQIILDGTHLDDLTLSLYQSIDFVTITEVNYPLYH